MAAELVGVSAVADGIPLRDASLQVARGALTVLLGSPAAGASTLLRLLAGEVRPSRGRVLVDDVEAERGMTLVDDARAASIGSFGALLGRGRTVVAAFHHLDDAAYFADQVVLLKHGEIVASGLPDIVLRRSLLEAVFALPCRTEWSAHRA